MPTIDYSRSVKLIYFNVFNKDYVPDREYLCQLPTDAEQVVGGALLVHAPLQGLDQLIAACLDLVLHVEDGLRGLAGVVYSKSMFCRCGGLEVHRMAFNQFRESNPCRPMRWSEFDRQTKKPMHCIGFYRDAVKDYRTVDVMRATRRF